MKQNRGFIRNIIVFSSGSAILCAGIFAWLAPTGDSRIDLLFGALTGLLTALLVSLVVGLLERMLLPQNPEADLVDWTISNAIVGTITGAVIMTLTIIVLSQLMVATFTAPPPLVWGVVWGRLTGTLLGTGVGFVIGVSWRWLALRATGKNNQIIAILILLLLAGCGQTADTPTATPTTDANGSVLAAPEGVQMAHAVLLTHLAEQFDLILPAAGASWQVELATPQSIIGTSTYRLSIDNCVVTISYPLTSPESTIYQVVLDDYAAQFHWEGEIDAQGLVLSPVSEIALRGTINIVAAADLQSTVRIDVCELDFACYEPLLTIDDSDLVSDLVAALDREMPLVARARCPAVYQIQFTLADGQQRSFGYTCEMKSPVFLRGSQDFWGDLDGVAPDVFNKIMLPLLDAQIGMK